MDTGAGRTDPEPTALAPITPAKRRLHAAWRESAQSRIVDLDVEIDCLIEQLRSEMSAAQRRIDAGDHLVECRGRGQIRWGRKGVHLSEDPPVGSRSLA
ncbi:hypothetical protein AWC09_11190 [Mycolicibacter hiberniae]|nr:hypothetical protein AWC09_11190 [Mycolicibacter hiberniae]